MSSPGQGGVQQTHPYTCNTCQVAFRSSELQRGHMQSDWHRYNLKRRVASLPPLSSEIFAEKVLANKATQAATAARASYEKSCQACQKTYYSENAFINHLSSQKHKANALRQQKGVATNGDDAASMMSSTFSLGDPLETASNSVADGEAEREFADVINGIQKSKIEDDEPLSQRPSRPHHSSTDGGTATPHPLSQTTTETSSAANGADGVSDGPVLHCLFCNYRSPTFETNVHHMSRQHDLFIPEREYLTDLEGLIGYLHVKVAEEHECLYCGKTTHTASGIMTHMRDRGHCKIAFDSQEEQVEIGQFYDFRATYSDPEGEDDESDWTDDEDDTTGKKSNGVKLGAKRAVKTSIEAEGEDEAMEDEGWETDSTLSSVPTDEIGAVPIDDHSHRYASLHNSRHHSHRDTRPHKSSDGLYHSRAHRTPHAVYYDDFEMHLPSGRSVGHRNMNKYWRQNLRSYPSAAERAERLAITHGTAVEGEDVDEDTDSDVDMDGSTPRPSSRNWQLQRGHDAGRQLASNSRANGGLGMVGVTAAKKKEVTRAEKRERGRARRDENRYQAGNERRNNFQKHFRDPLLQ